jgi:phosphatidylglycerophosphate synthase/diacylglycerol kinase family enzyme
MCYGEDVNLHRVGKRPDWQLVPSGQWNSWQRIAARTAGVVTPANVLSVAGIIIVGWGAAYLHQQSFLNGLFLVALGRLADVFDGIVAEVTGTKSPLGEALDAALDKLAILLVLVIFVEQNIIPLPALAAIVTLHVLIALLGVIAKLRKREFHANQYGKLSMAAVWIALIAYGLATLPAGQPAEVATATLANVSCLLAILLGILALNSYAVTALYKRRHPPAVRQGMAAEFKRFVIVQNPTSTDIATAKKHLAQLHKLFPQAEYHITETIPGDREANRKLFEQFADKLGPDTLVCIAAGDGTANLIIETLLISGNLPPQARHSPVLPLWGGNANDLAFMLNGKVTPAHLKDVFSSGRLVPIYPLECVMRLKHRGRQVRLAACYASFGASAYAAQRLNEPLHRRSWLHAIPGGRSLQELATVARAFAEALPFTITENGTARPVYERIFANGSRIARLETMPGRLTEGGFYRVTIENKQLSLVALRLFHLISKRWPHKSFSRPARFTTHEAIWAQFDGEAIHVPAETKVTIRLSREPFYALSTKLDTSNSGAK